MVRPVLLDPPLEWGLPSIDKMRFGKCQMDAKDTPNTAEHVLEPFDFINHCKQEQHNTDNSKRTHISAKAQNRQQQTYPHFNYHQRTAQNGQQQTHPLGTYLAPTWHLLRHLLGHLLGTVLGHLLGTHGHLLGTHLGPTWHPLGAYLATYLATYLAPYLATYLAPTWHLLGTHLGSTWHPLGPTKHPLATYLATYLAPTWLPTWHLSELRRRVLVEFGGLSGYRRTNMKGRLRGHQCKLRDRLGLMQEWESEC